MSLKNFKSYSSYYSKDPKNFEKKIALASSKLSNLPMFEVVNTIDSALQIPKDIPVIQWNNFSFSSNKVDESFCSTVYNQSTIPTRSELNSEFNGESFIPNKIVDRSLVKKMKFPIIGYSANGEDEFKTYGKFKKSEKPYNSFQEKRVPSARFEVLASGDSPIHVQKKINKTPFDIDITRWKHLGEASDICKKINDKWSPEYYVISLVESDGKLLLESINRSSDLTPSQGVKLYEDAYEDYYSAKLPSWFKTKMFDDHVKPYYKQKYYDSLLLKPSGVIDYKKYIN
jgi:hypothetical protein